MKIQLPLRGPLKWLILLAFVWIYPVTLVYGFAPESDAGKEALHLMSLYLVIPLVLLFVLAALNLLERAWKSWHHWQREPHQPGTPFLLGEKVTTLFNGEHIAPFLAAFALNGLMCLVVGTVIQVVIKLLTWL